MLPRDGRLAEQLRVRLSMGDVRVGTVEGQHVAGAMTLQQLDPNTGVADWTVSIGQLFQMNFDTLSFILLKNLESGRTGRGCPTGCPHTKFDIP